MARRLIIVQAMMYRLLADIAVVIHLVFIIYGLLGGLLFFWRRWLIVLHFPLAVWISLIEFFGWTCPLTPLENSLRLAGGGLAYERGFIEHYLLPIIYPPGLTRNIELLLGLVAVGLNLLVYTMVWRYWRRSRVR